MGKKYIIDLNPDCVEGEYLRIPARIAGEEQWLVTKAALTPYTEPDLEQVRKEAYQKGYETGYEDGYNEPGKNQQEAYQRGLDDAWGTCKKIGCYEIDGGYPATQMLDLFDRDDLPKILSDYTASEAIEKIRQYEQKKEMDGLRQNIQTIVDQCGYTLDEIAAVLEKMRGEQDG